jgi:hypothetical protein
VTAQETQGAQDLEPAADEAMQTDETEGGEDAAGTASGDARKDG